MNKEVLWDDKIYSNTVFTFKYYYVRTMNIKVKQTSMGYEKEPLGYSYTPKEDKKVLHVKKRYI